MSNLNSDYTGFKLGRHPARLSDHMRSVKLGDFIGEALPEPPRDVDHLSPMTSIPMLGNDRYGDCVIAGIAHYAQSVSATMGRERIYTEDQVLDVYSAVTGFDRNDPSTDLGTNMYQAMTWWLKNGFYGVEIEGFASVDAHDWKKLQQAMWLMGGCLFGVDLPLVAQRQDVWRLEMGVGDDQVQVGGWGGHCVAAHRRRFSEMGRPIVTVSTWGAAKDVTSSFVDCGYVEEAFCPLIKGWVPPNVPGFDRDALLRAMKELSR